MSRLFVSYAIGHIYGGVIGGIIEDNTTFICLGSREYSLENLFKNGEWKPFGVEE